MGLVSSYLQSLFLLSGVKAFAALEGIGRLHNQSNQILERKKGRREGARCWRSELGASSE